jgi:hypothetical protein
MRANLGSDQVPLSFQVPLFVPRQCTTAPSFLGRDFGGLKQPGLEARFSGHCAARPPSASQVVLIDPIGMISAKSARESILDLFGTGIDFVPAAI